MDSQYASGATLGRVACPPRFCRLTPTVVSKPRLRNRLPRVIASLTEPPLESSTIVAPPSCRARAKSSKSFGVSAVMMPTALTQPRQLGSQATQVNFIGSLRSSRVPPACAEEPKVANAPNDIKQAAVPIRSQPRGSSDLRSFKLVPFPKAPKRSGEPHSLPDELYAQASQKWYPGEYRSSIGTCCTAL